MLPPYSPNLNPIERLWKWLKESVIVNRFHKNKKEIEKSVQTFWNPFKRLRIRYYIASVVSSRSRNVKIHLS
ncbi:transposase [Aneurinibacillus sp. BA2021]|nr:transposase [Aneurinibacillus sp. BA2021]